MKYTECVHVRDCYDCVCRHNTNNKYHTIYINPRMSNGGDKEKTFLLAISFTHRFQRKKDGWK